MPSLPKKLPVKKPAAKPITAFGTDLSLPQRSAAPPLGGTPGQISAAVQTGQDEANNANDLRYGQQLGVLNQGYNTSLGDIEKAIADSEQLGQGAQRQVNQQYTNDIGSDQQRATSRGLGNTTILNAMNDQSRRRRDEANANLTEQAAGRRSNLRLQEAQLGSNASGTIANAIASRNDTGPDLNTWAQLMAQAAAAPNGQRSTSTTVSPAFRAGMASGGSNAGYDTNAATNAANRAAWQNQQAPTVNAPFSMQSMYPPAGGSQGGEISSYLNPAQAAAQKGTSFMANGGSVGYTGEGNALVTPNSVTNMIPANQRGSIIIKKTNPFG